MAHAFDVVSRKYLPELNPQRLSPIVIFSLVLGFTLRCIIHFGLIFVYGMRNGSMFLVCLYIDIQFFQHHLLKKLHLSAELFFFLCL